MREIKVAFCSSSPELWPVFVEKMRTIRPDLPLVVVSEFAVPGEEWIPWHFKRSTRDNLEKLAWHFRDCRIVLGALILQPRTPVWSMRWAALRFSGLHTLFYNENLDHYMLRPRSAPTIARHLWWRVKSMVGKELRPAGTTYTFIWRLGHPEALRRPWWVRRAMAVGGESRRGRGWLWCRRDPGRRGPRQHGREG